VKSSGYASEKDGEPALADGIAARRDLTP
jgi:hypothetical protein